MINDKLGGGDKKLDIGVVRSSQLLWLSPVTWIPNKNASAGLQTAERSYSKGYASVAYYPSCAWS